MKNLISSVVNTAKFGVQMVKDHKFQVLKGAGIVGGAAAGMALGALLNRKDPYAPTETIVPDPITDID